MARWPGCLLTTPPLPPVSSGSGRVSRSSWWTGWSRARTWCWSGWCPPPSPRSPGPRSPMRASSPSPASSCRPLNPTRSRAVWTQTKVGDHFSLFMLDVIIIDDDVDYIFYIVYVQYRPLYNYYLLSGLQTPLLMTHIILCSTKCKHIFKLQYLRARAGINGLLVFIIV